MRTWQLLLAWVLIGDPALACRDRMPWDDLPLLQRILFSEAEVGFEAPDGRALALSRSGGGIISFSRSLPYGRFSSVGPAVFEQEQILETGSRAFLLPTSSGRMFRSIRAYCGEGESLHHSLSEGQRKIKNPVPRCTSIDALETVGPNLWLGTVRHGECGEFGEGIVVMSSQTGGLIKKIGESDGLTGDLIRLIRLDPFTGRLWIATAKGINEIDTTYRVHRSMYLYEDFDAATGTCKTFASTVFRESEPFAVITRQLAVKNPHQFLAAVHSLPPAVRAKFNLYSFADEVFGPLPGGESTARSRFAPSEMNILVPFFLEAAESSNHEVQHFALWKLKVFDDPRAIAYYTAGLRNVDRDRSDQCKWAIEKYRAAGRISKEP